MRGRERPISEPACDLINQDFHMGCDQILEVTEQSKLTNHFILF